MMKMNKSISLQDPPVKPEKNIPVKPDKDPDPTLPKPKPFEPEKNDPTRIDDPPIPQPGVNPIS